MFQPKKSPSIILFLALTTTFFTIIFSIAPVLNGTNRYLELLSHFKMHYLLLSIACVFVFVLIRQYKIAVVMVFLVFFNATSIIPWSISAKKYQETTPLKIMHSNVLMRNTKHQAFIDLVHKEAPHIVVVQEINKRWEEKLTALHKAYPYHYTTPREDNFGIGIFSQYPFDSVKEEYWELSAVVPSLKVMMTIAGQKVMVITTHPLPPTSPYNYASRNAQLKRTVDIVNSIKQPLILIGDLNVTMWSGSYTALEAETQLRNSRKGFGILPTWPTMVPSLLMIPIDHCLVSSHFVVQDMKTGNNIGSDHLPLIVALGLKK